LEFFSDPSRIAAAVQDGFYVRGLGAHVVINCEGKRAAKQPVGAVMLSVNPSVEGERVDVRKQRI
jgi:hypothetical protein